MYIHEFNCMCTYFIESSGLEKTLKIFKSSCQSDLPNPITKLHPLVDIHVSLECLQG